MELTVRFKSEVVGRSVVYIPRHKANLGDLDMIRKLEGDHVEMKDVFGVVSGCHHVSYRAVLDEDMARSSGLFEHDAEATVNVPPHGLHKFLINYTTEVAGQIKLVHDVNSTGLVTAWIEAGAPLTWKLEE